MTKELTVPKGVRFLPSTISSVEKAGKADGRNFSNTIVYIVHQYLSSTNGKLLKNIKIVPVETEAA